jgi:hypothetical protein
VIAAPEPTRRPEPRTDRWTAQQRHTAARNAARIGLRIYDGDAAAARDALEALGLAPTREETT